MSLTAYEEVSSRYLRYLYLDFFASGTEKPEWKMGGERLKVGVLDSGDKWAAWWPNRDLDWANHRCFRAQISHTFHDFAKDKMLA